MTLFIEEALLSRRHMSYETQSGPAVMVDLTEAPGGWGQAVILSDWPRHRFHLTVRHTNANIGALRRAFIVCRGPALGLRLSDPGDYTTALDGQSPPSPTDQSVGVSDGVTTTFDLYKQYDFGGIVLARRIVKPVMGTVSVGLDGVPTPTGWTLDHLRGRITFSTAPAAGTGITWGGRFDVPVRFDIGADGGGWRALMQTFSDYGVSDLQVDLIEIVAEQAIAEAGL